MTSALRKYLRVLPEGVELSSPIYTIPFQRIALKRWRYTYVNPFRLENEIQYGKRIQERSLTSGHDIAPCSQTIRLNRAITDSYSIITRRKQMHNINSEIYFFFFLTRIHSFQSTDSKNLPILSPFPFTSVPSILFHPSPPLFLYLSELENTSRINKWWSRFTRPTGYERSLTSGNGRCVSISVIEILRNIGRNSTRKVIHPESIRPIVEPMKAAL